MTLATSFQNLAGIVSNALGTRIVLSRVPASGYDTTAGAMVVGTPLEQTLNGVWGIANNGKQGKTGGASEVRGKSRKFTIAAIDVKWEPKIGDTAQIGDEFFDVEHVEPIYVKELVVQYTLTLESA
jgi:hypothetical protein